MRLREVLVGEVEQIYAIDLSDERPEDGCPALDFYRDADQLVKRGARTALLNTFRRHVNAGRFKSAGRLTKLEGTHSVWEFKTPHGARIFCFFGSAGRTILTHGFAKKSNKTPPQQIARAEDLQARHLEMVGGAG
jgi:phage-related protein